MELWLTDKIIARFWSRVDRMGDCWVWQGAKTSGGYGNFCPAKHAFVPAHRFAWRASGGTLTDGLVLDHLCRNRACVRPEHLREVSHRTNILSGTGFSAHKATQTECVNGHEFDETNTIIRPNGTRACRTCKNARRKRYPSYRTPAWGCA